MIGLEGIERIIELSLISGYVKDDTAPLSLMLISKPECAKTSMLLKFDCPHTVETTDLSAKPIVDVIIPKLNRNEIHHIIVPDMVKVLSHRETTVSSTIAFLNALMEEGVKQNLFFGQSFEFKERKKCGLITAVTFDFYYKVYRKWKEIGFTTRFIPISYKYSKDTISNVHRAIETNTLFNEVKKMKKIGKKKIIIPKEISAWMNVQTSKIVNEQSNQTMVIRVKGGKQKREPMKIYGFRFHRQLRKMLQSIALSHQCKEVTWEHARELETLLDYIRMPKNAKVI